ncbi:hypothetical protein [Phormidium sp. CCY1219]|uniref:hypothetical protein n=1 Tax=Phormidium sp. CCY1219 TaxID=2886104 RepID=UPI002D1E7AF5|nr:hypothetical protein [Phormidium sp. CCY1219]MEB3829987.1 hypothetical protein [Phormidium sp. CCY1219]
MMANPDMRGELYRGWILLPLAVDDIFFYEIHSPEGYRNYNLMPFDSPESALDYARGEVDRIVEIFEVA